MNKRKLFKELLKNSRLLTEKEVQELRDKAKKYAESGGKYLDKQELVKFIMMKARTLTSFLIATNVEYMKF